MKKLLILSLGMAAFAGCASDASGPKREEDDSLKDRGSFCKAWANAACTDEVVQACQSTDKETCLVAQKAFCVELVPAGYVSTTAEKCIAAVKSAYSDEELTKEELDVVVNLGGACSQLVKGGIESGGTCRASTECDTTRGYSCVVKPGSSDGTCQIAKLQEPASKCTGLDQICQSGTTPIVVPRAGIGPVPSENSATSSITSSAPYNTTSTGVRAVPFVSGTRFGHGGNRIVLGRNQ